MVNTAEIEEHNYTIDNIKLLLQINPNLIKFLSKNLKNELPEFQYQDLC